MEFSVSESTLMKWKWWYELPQTIEDSPKSIKFNTKIFYLKKGVEWSSGLNIHQKFMDKLIVFFYPEEGVEQGSV